MIQVDGIQKDPAPIPVVVDASELAYLDGLSSNIQTQLDGKAASSHTHAASAITSGTLAQARGGTGADLSATGGTSQVLKQVSAGAAITVAQLTLADLAAGTLGVRLDLGAVPIRFTGAGTATNTQTEIYASGAAGDLSLSAPSGQAINFKNAGTNYLRVLAALVTLGAAPLRFTGAGSGTSTEVEIYASANQGHLNLNAPSGQSIDLRSGGSLVAEIFSGSLNLYGRQRFSGAGSGTSTETEIYADASAGNLNLNAPTTKSLRGRVAGNIVFTLGAGLNGTGDERFGLGAYGFLGSAASSAKSGIGSSGSTSMEYNVNTGGIHKFSIAGTTTLLALGAGINTVADKAWGLGAFGRLGSAASPGEAGIGYGGSGAIYSNVPTGATQIKSFQGATVYTFAAGSLTFADAVDLIVGSTSGTKIGTATSQKLGFWNAAPVVQQVLATGVGATVDNVISLLQTLGLCKQS